MFPVHPVHFLWGCECLYDADQKDHSYIPGQISKAETTISADINFILIEECNDVNYQYDNTANNTKNKERVG